MHLEVLNTFKLELKLEQTEHLVGNSKLIC